MTYRHIRVGETPKRRYANWDEHREALRKEAEGRRAEVDARRNIVQPSP